ncbi:MAG TPA: hypothetical protein DCE14_08835, partial [Kosmotogaceae bacterium]|nr:hypothetical protein [Kosmotogaceae bacterium]
MRNIKRNFTCYGLLTVLIAIGILFSGCLVAPAEPSEVVFETDPEEIHITINGEARESPSSVVVRKGSELVVVVEPMERMESASIPGNDTRYVFDRWDDGDKTNPR